MYQTVLSSLLELANKSQEETLQAMAAEAQVTMTTAETLPFHVVVASSGYERTCVLQQLSGYCPAISTATDYLPGQEQPLQLVISYGQPEIQSDTGLYGKVLLRKLHLYTEDEWLKNRQVTYWSGVDFAQLNQEVYQMADALVLVTNATMALSTKEKDWLRSLVPQYGGDRIAVLLSGQQMVNDPEDLTTLYDTSRIILGTIHQDIQLIEQVQGLETVIAVKEASMEPVKKRRQQTVLQVATTQMTQLLQQRLQMGEIDQSALATQVEKMGKERKSIEAAGRFMVCSTVENFYDQLRLHMLDAADQYFDEAYKSICGRIKASKIVAEDVELIEPYLKGAVANFQRQLEEKLSTAQATLCEEIQQQILEDCKSLATLVPLAQSMTAFAYSTSNTIGASQTTGDEARRQEKFLSKTLLVASVALAFANPVWGLGLFVGSKIYFKTKSKNQEDIRQMALQQTAILCGETKKQVCTQVESAMEQTKQTTKAQMEACYAQALQQTVDAIESAVRQLQSIGQRQALLQQMVSQDLPALLKHL